MQHDYNSKLFDRMGAKFRAYINNRYLATVFLSIGPIKISDFFYTSHVNFSVFNIFINLVYITTWTGLLLCGLRTGISSRAQFEYSFLDRIYLDRDNIELWFRW